MPVVVNPGTAFFFASIEVLPPQSKGLLPPKYRELMTSEESPILQYYPTRVSLENHLAYYFHYCEPRLPILYVDDIIEATNAIPLTEKEKELNTINEIFEYCLILEAIFILSHSEKNVQSTF